MTLDRDGGDTREMETTEHDERKERSSAGAGSPSDCFQLAWNDVHKKMKWCTVGSRLDPWMESLIVS